MVEGRDRLQRPHPGRPRSLPDRFRRTAPRLTAIAHRVVECQAGEKGWCVGQRLVYAEPPASPTCTTRSAKAPPSASSTRSRAGSRAWPTADTLDIDDPVTAANQFLGLISGDLPTLTALGTRPWTTRPSTAPSPPAVTTFLRAFLPRERRHRPRRHDGAPALTATCAAPDGRASVGTAASNSRV